MTKLIGYVAALIRCFGFQTYIKTVAPQIQKRGMNQLVKDLRL